MADSVKTVGFTASAFDLLHAGHVSMLEEASSLCDVLVCGLHIDPSKERAEKSAPAQPVFERYMQLSAVRYVDKVIPYETEADLLQLIAMVSPSVRIIGEEYRDVDFTGRELCKELGIRVHFNKRKHNLSSSLQRQRSKKLSVV